MRVCSSRGALLRSLSTALAALVVLAAAAQCSQARVFTLDECIETALTHNLTLAGAREDVHSARAGVLSSWSSVLPHVSASVSKSNNREVDDGPGSRWETARGGLTLSQTLLDGSSFAGISGSHHSRRAAELGLESTRRRVIFETKEAYYSLIRAVELRGVQEEALELAREQLRKTQSLFDLGSASKSDLLKAQVQVGDAELSLIAAEKSAETARAGLAFQLGIDVTTDMEAVDPGDGQSEEEIASFDMESAVSSRPDIQAWEATLTAARRSVLSAKAGRWPELGLSVSYNRSSGSLDGLFDDLGDDYSTSTTLSLSVPIFNGLSTKADIDSRKSALRSYELSLRNARLSAAYEIENARLSVDEGRRSVAVSTDAVTQAEEDLRVSEERFRLRAASMLELIDARVGYSRARAELVDARYNYEIAKAELRLALGL